MDYQWMWRLARAYELELATIGGDDLVDDARSEADWYVQLFHPWDGRGPEPTARIHAWLSILHARLTRERHRRRPTMGADSNGRTTFLTS